MAILSEVTTEIKTLLGRNLFIPKALKERILTASESQQYKALKLLQVMDQKQTELFKKILRKNPHFFSDLENMAVHEVLRKLVEHEEAEHLKEIKIAEQELEQMLSTI